LAFAYRTDVGTTDYSVISRSSAGNPPLYVQSADSDANQPIAKFFYGNATPNQGSIVLNLAKDSTYFSNTNVGIGTTAPSQKLHISGNMRLTGAFRDRLNSQGTANYVLTSTGSNGTQWVDASSSSVIGGPYLPLTAGSSYPLTGRLYAQDDIYISGSHVIKNTNNNLFLDSASGYNVIIRPEATEAMRITSAGNVGIGTTSPGAKLQVGTRGTAGALTPPATDGILFDFHNDGPPYTRHAAIISQAGDSSESVIDFWTKEASGTNSKKMTLRGNGNVGIGTTSPSQKLEVNGNVIIGGGTLDNPQSWGKILQVQNTGSNGAGISVKDSSKEFNISTYGSKFYISDGVDERITITSTGNVGIGTDSPFDSKLQVDGRIRAAGGTSGGYFFGSEEFDGGFYAPSDGNLAFSTNNTERIRIDGNGNVGIGTTSPGTINGVAFSSVGLHTKFGTLGRTITEGSQWGEYIMNHSGETANRRAKFIQSKAGDINIGSYDDNGTQRLHARLDNNGTFFLGNTSTAYQTVFFDSTPGTVYGNGTLQISPLTSPGSGIAQFTTNFADRVGGGTTKHNVRVGGTVTATDFIGGSGAYLPLAGGTMTGDLRFQDNVKILMGAGDMFQIKHTGTLSQIATYEGDLFIDNNAADKDIIFRSDDGSGGLVTYFYLDGSKADGTGNLYTNFPDKSHLTFGTKPNGDLQIYHDGSHSYINDAGTGALKILASQLEINNAANTENIATFTQDGAVSLFYNNAQKFATESTGVTVAGDIKIDSALLSNQENTDVDTGAEVVAQVAHATYTAAFFDFVVKKGTNVRSGTVYACHDGTNVEFTETSTNDLGDTSDVTLSVDKTSTNLRLIATVTSDDWSVKSLIRAI